MHMDLADDRVGYPYKQIEVPDYGEGANYTRKVTKCPINQGYIGKIGQVTSLTRPAKTPIKPGLLLQV